MSPHQANVIFRAAALGMASVAEAASAAAAAMARLSRALGRPDPLEARRSRFGGMTEDLRMWPDQWQSFYCAGFLCQQCPSDQHDLRCTHSCHTKEMKR